MARDEMAAGTIKWPNAMQKDSERLKMFSDRCHEACKTMIARLSDALQLDEKDRFEQSHRDGERSDSGLKLIYEPSLEKKSQVGDNLHTDSGTMTFLFYDKWGLSAYAPSQDFAFTAPIDGCALINIGDSLQRLSNNRLLSPKHRVTQPVDGAEKRYYLSYFVRPEHAVKDAWSKA